MSQINVDTIRNAAGSGGSLSLSGGDFNFDSNTLFVDVSTNRVGIGTGTPAAALDIRSTTQGTMFAAAPLMEKTNVDTSNKVNAVTNIDLLTSSVHVFTTASDGNWTHNIRGSASTSLNSLVEVGQTVVYVCITNLGGSAGFTTALQIDGSNVTTYWNTGTAPAAKGGGTYDMYTFTCIKTANASWLVFGNANTF
tara:strand:- start:2942 stop:3526 length:585 start_codon:yes stop_codon:yes gene_type:complete